MTFAYDEMGRVTSVSGTGASTFRYDGDGRRVERGHGRRGAAHGRPPEPEHRRRHDDATGMEMLGARYDLPALGRSRRFDLATGDEDDVPFRNRSGGLDAWKP